MDPLDDARAQAVKDVASAILAAAGEALARHGADPQSDVILIGAFVITVRSLTTKVIPDLRQVLIKLLLADEANPT